MDQRVTDKIHLPQGQVQGKPRILVAPLDWGLGHATRCIPIIHELLAQGSHVFLAGEGAQELLLKKEFPDLPFLQLPGYRIRYSRTKTGLIWKMIKQGPKMRKAIRQEHEWLNKMVKEYSLDGIISDNRYGLYHATVPAVFMTHQLTIKTPLGKWTEKILQKRNYRYINRFTECWVPDNAEQNNFAGELSHPQKKPAIPLRYTGLLSRFKKEPGNGSHPEKKGHLLIILSGPEPQRTILEEKMIRDIANYNGTATIVRGLPGVASLIPSTNMIMVYNHLPADELNNAMQDAEYIISRSGYSTVMDTVVLQKKTILIPTPGQTEQEYLGSYLMSKGKTLCVNQEDFSLTTALARAATYSYDLSFHSRENILQETVTAFLTQSRKPALG